MSFKEIPTVVGGMGVSVVSTPSGIMTGYEAKKKISAENYCVLSGKNMSRIGRSPVVVPQGVTVVIKDGVVLVTGSVERSLLPLPEGITAEVKDQTIRIARSSDGRVVRSHHGFARATIMNNVTGVSHRVDKNVRIVRSRI